MVGGRGSFEPYWVSSRRGSLHSLVVALPGAKTALPIVAVQLIQLGKKILIVF